MAAIYNDESKKEQFRRETKKKFEELGFYFKKYDGEATKEFLNFFREMKDLEVGLVSGRNKVGKTPNYQLLDYLLNPKMDDSISELLNYIYNEKIRDKSIDLAKDMLLNKKLVPFLVKDKYISEIIIKSEVEERIPKVRNFIRNNVINAPNLSKLQFFKSENGKIKYEGKIQLLEEVLLKSDLGYQKAVCKKKGVKLEKNFLEELYFIRQHQMILSEVITQLIMYDVLLLENEEIKIDKKNKLTVVLDEMLKELEERKKIYGNIYKDFFSFMYLQEQIKKWQRQENIQAEIIVDDEINSRIKSNKLSKEEIVKYFIAQEGELTDFCGVNFEDVLEIKKIIDQKNNYFISKNDIKQNEFFSGKNIYKKKTNVSKVVYGTEKTKNNYNDEIAALKMVLDKFPYLKGNNLQALKVIVNELESSVIVIGEERKKIKTIIMEYYKLKKKAEKENSSVPNEFSLEVEAYIREKITRGMYVEKGIEKEYYFSHMYQKKISMIFEKINKMNNIEEINKLCYLVMKNIFHIIGEINKEMDFIPKKIDY